MYLGAGLRSLPTAARMEPDPDADTIVTLPEVAHLLKAADKTVYTIATRPRLMLCDARKQS